MSVTQTQKRLKYSQGSGSNCPCRASDQDKKCEFTSVNNHFLTQSRGSTGVS